MPVDPMREAPMLPDLPAPEMPAPEAPAPKLDKLPLPGEKPEKPKPLTEPESPQKLADMAQELFDQATKMQRLAEDIMKAIPDEEPEPLEEEAEMPEKPEKPMSPEEGEAASKALIGM